MRVVTVALASLWGAAQLTCAAPSNDLFSAAILLSGENVSTAAANSGASLEAGEPQHAAQEGRASLWWKWTAPDEGETEIVTDGSDFNTLLAVYTGSAVTALTEVASNDDHADDSVSRVRFASASNVTYYIAVDGKNSSVATGTVDLALSFQTGSFVPPEHDLFTGASSVSGMFFTVASSNVNALREPGEPLHAFWRAGGNASVWWRWTAEGDGLVRLNTRESAIDTLLAVYQGSSLTGLTEIASSDDIKFGEIFTSEVEFTVEQGETFMIAVDGYDGEMGALALNMAWVELPYNIMSPYGLPYPEVGTYTNDWGTLLTNACTGFDTRDTTQYVCTGWSLSGGVDTNGVSEGTATNMVMALTDNSVLSWLWRTNYWLDTEADANGSVGPADAWHPLGTNVEVAATADPHYHFTGWRGAGTNRITVGDANSATVTVAMAGPVQLVAGFAASLATNGVPHWWLAGHGLTAPFDDSALSDSDGDGLMAWEEFYADTDPTNSASVLRIVGIDHLADDLRILWQGGHDARQLLESRGEAGAGEWSTIFTNIPPTEATNTLVLDSAPYPMQFYRIRVLP